MIVLAFYLGRLEGGQPVPHPDFENQRFTVPRYLGGPEPPLPADLGASVGPGRNSVNTYIYIYDKTPPR